MRFINANSIIIGASRSEPHTNHSYEKIAVPMYVCINLCARVHNRRESESILLCILLCKRIADN